MSWNSIKKYIEDTLCFVQNELDDNAVEAVRHYLENAEYEMAFEGLIIEIMNLKYRPAIDWDECRKVGIELGLNQDSVFKIDFWERFENYISSVS